MKIKQKNQIKLYKNLLKKHKLNYNLIKNKINNNKI